MAAEKKKKGCQKIIFFQRSSKGKRDSTFFMKKKNYFPDTFGQPPATYDSPEKIQERLLKSACKETVRQVKEAMKIGYREITISLPSPMTEETKRRFWTDLEERVGAESLSIPNGIRYDSNPPQYGRDHWTVAGALGAEYVYLKI